LKTPSSHRLALKMEDMHGVEIELFHIKPFLFPNDHQSLKLVREILDKILHCNGLDYLDLELYLVNSPGQSFLSLYFQSFIANGLKFSPMPTHGWEAL
jgi:hypothetical protein